MPTLTHTYICPECGSDNDVTIQTNQSNDPLDHSVVGDPICVCRHKLDKDDVIEDYQNDNT